MNGLAIVRKLGELLDCVAHAEDMVCVDGGLRGSRLAAME